MLHLAGASMSRGKAIRAIHITNQAVKQSQSQSPSPFTRTQLRSFQLSPGVYAMAHAAKVQFATGADETTLTAALQGLLDSAEKGGRWSLIPSGRGLERSFKFKNFAKTWVSLQEPCFHPFDMLRYTSTSLYCAIGAKTSFPKTAFVFCPARDASAREKTDFHHAADCYLQARSYHNGVEL